MQLRASSDSVGLSRRFVFPCDFHYFSLFSLHSSNSCIKIIACPPWGQKIVEALKLLAAKSPSSSGLGNNPSHNSSKNESGLVDDMSRMTILKVLPVLYCIRQQLNSQRRKMLFLWFLLHSKSRKMTHSLQE